MPPALAPGMPIPMKRLGPTVSILLVLAACSGSAETVPAPGGQHTGPSSSSGGSTEGGTGLSSSGSVIGSNGGESSGSTAPASSGSSSGGPPEAGAGSSSG